jgi:hypothetical protein
MYAIQLRALTSTVRFPRPVPFAVACRIATSPSVPRGVTVEVVDLATGRVVL